MAVNNPNGVQVMLPCLTGRSHGELGRRFTAHSLPLSSDEMRSAEMGRGESYEGLVEFSTPTVPILSPNR